MKLAAGKALEWVSLEVLQPKHLKELARAIHGALVDPVVRAQQSLAGAFLNLKFRPRMQKIASPRKIVHAAYILFGRCRKRRNPN